jgi:ABC-type Fe3+ transport system permease subunit
MSPSLTEAGVRPASTIAGPATLPAPRYRRVLGLDRSRLLQYATLVVLAVLVVAPIAPILYQSVIDRPLYEVGQVLTFGNFTALFSEAGFADVIVNTVVLAVLTTGLTVLIAVPMAVLVVRTRLPFGQVLGLSMQWPFYISSLILGFGWITMYGPAGFVSVQVRELVGFVPWDLYTIPGMALTEAVAMAPVAYVFCANALRQADAALESAAQVCGAKPMRILLTVVVPMLRPPIIYATILTFSASIESLSVPLLYGTLFGAAIPILGLVFRSFTLIFTPLQNPFRTVTLENYAHIFRFDDYVRSITNSVTVAAAGAVVVSLLALIAVIVARRSPFRFRRAVEYLAFAPQAIPGIIVGIGFFWAFALLPGGGLFEFLFQGTLVALVIVFVFGTVPTAFSSIASSITQLGPELDNAARTSGADWVGAFVRILWRLLVPAFVGALILAFVAVASRFMKGHTHA